MKEPTLGVAIITKNAAPRLAECLCAVAFADAIVVIDGASTDGTVEIAEAHGARVLQQPDWPGFGPQKNRALDALDTDWILSIDADESGFLLCRGVDGKLGCSGRKQNSKYNK